MEFPDIHNVTFLTHIPYYEHLGEQYCERMGEFTHIHMKINPIIYYLNNYKQTKKTTQFSK